MDTCLSPCVHGTSTVYCTYPVHASIYTYTVRFSLHLILVCVLSDGDIILKLCYNCHRGVVLLVRSLNAVSLMARSTA